VALFLVAPLDKIPQNVIAELTPIDQLELIQKQVFNVLDISEGTRKEYSVRIKYFIRHTHKLTVSICNWENFQVYRKPNNLSAIVV
jgi:hypothetical protein